MYFICGELRSTSGAVHPLPPPFFRTWSSPYIADKPQGFTCPCLHSTEITDMHQLAWLFCVGSEG